MSQMMTGNGYPMQDAVAKRLCHYTGGIQGGYGQVRDVPTKYYHRQNFPNNGTRNMRFFNVARSRGICNLDTPSTIPANQAFALAAIRFDFLPGIDVNGARSTVSATPGLTALSFGSAGAVITDTLTKAQWQWQEKIRELMEQGIVTFTLNNRPVFEVAKLTSFPSGTGINLASTSDTGFTSAAGNSVSHFAGQISNGAPLLANAFRFPEPFPMPGGCVFDVSVDWLALVDFTAATLGPLNGETAGNPAGTIACELEGILITPGSN